MEVARAAIVSAGTPDTSRRANTRAIGDMDSSSTLLLLTGESEINTNFYEQDLPIRKTDIPRITLAWLFTTVLVIFIVHVSENYFQSKIH